MLDGRFDPDFYRSLAEGQVSDSHLDQEHEGVGVDPIVLRVWLATLVAAIALYAWHMA